MPLDIEKLRKFIQRQDRIKNMALVIHKLTKIDIIEKSTYIKELFQTSKYL